MKRFLNDIKAALGPQEEYRLFMVLQEWADYKDQPEDREAFIFFLVRRFKEMKEMGYSTPALESAIDAYCPAGWDDAKERTLMAYYSIGFDLGKVRTLKDQHPELWEEPGFQDLITLLQMIKESQDPNDQARFITDFTALTGISIGAASFTSPPLPVQKRVDFREGAVKVKGDSIADIMLDFTPPPNPPALAYGTVATTSGIIVPNDNVLPGIPAPNENGPTKS